jgi:hypothetical protein
MTRINASHRLSFQPRRPSRSLGTAVSPTRTAITVNDTPIEEVIFEANGSVDQRSKNRGFFITESQEDTLIEQPQRGGQQERFWEGFSAPFMAQMIGHVAPQGRPNRTLAYRNTELAVRRPDEPHLISKAC